MSFRMKRQVEIVAAPLLVGADAIVCFDERFGCRGFLGRHKVDDSVGFPQHKPAFARRPDWQRVSAFGAEKQGFGRNHPGPWIRRNHGDAYYASKSFLLD